MWPNQPDELDAGHIPPDDADHGDAWYFVFSRGELIVKSVEGSPEPITSDDFRWFDMEVTSKHFLGHYLNRPCFAVSAHGQPGEGYIPVGLRGLLGRTAQSLFYLAGRAQQVIEWHETHQYCGRCGGTGIQFSVCNYCLLGHVCHGYARSETDCRRCDPGFLCR